MSDNDALLTFDDIELYTFLRWRGRPAWVLDKGDHLMPGVEASHLHIEYADDADTERDTTNLHEKLVNRKLREQDGKLWVDFNNQLHPSDSPDTNNASA